MGHTIDVIVTATSSTGGEKSATSDQTQTVKPAPPSNTAAPVISGTAVQGQTLTTSNGSWTNDPTSYAYQWQECSGSACSDISGATASSYTLKASDVGDTIDVDVTATNASGSASATSAKTGTVTVPPPSNTALPVISGTAQQGQTLTATNGSWTNSPTSYAYQWQDCSGLACSDISGATGSSYTLQGSDVGSAIDVVVTATNDGGSMPATSAHTQTVTPLPPSNTAAPVISGTAVQGQTLTTSNGSWTNGPTSYAYQWQDCTSTTCSNISGATASSYTLPASDVGDTIDVVVKATNAGGSATATSAKTATVTVPSPPSNTAAPVISGTAQQGQTLTTSNGSWTNSPTSYTYQWQDCSGSACTSISGATGSSYTLQASDVGDTIDVVVKATNAGGSATATSAKTATVSAFTGGSGSGLHISARDMPCEGSTATTCADLLDANGDIVHMHGVDLSGTEYACIQGWGIFPNDGNGVAQNSAASVASMVAWHVNFVRIQLNEDCWLGINVGGISTSYVDTACTGWPGGCTAAPPSTGESYADAIESFVSLLHQNGIYTEIVDMWNAPGTDQSVGQSGSSSSFNGGTYYGPDEDHSPDMWASMAQTFKNDPDTILSPAGEEDVSMSCQMNGCSNEGLAPNNIDGLGSCSYNGGSGYCYNVAGLSQGVSVMRSNGFKGPIAIECADYGGMCDESSSQGSGATWLNDKPSDSVNPSQIIAEVHNYGGGDCTTDSCWDSQYLPILQAGYPMFYGELGENINGSDCDDSYLPHATSWADAYGVGYLNWTWTANTGDCEQLIGSYTAGTAPPVATFTGTTTNGSTSITSVSSTSGLSIGQVITGSGLPAGDTIVSISGSTLTMGLESTATASSVSMTAEQANAGWVQAHDQSFVNAAPMTNISRGATAYGYADSGGSVGSYPASYATDNQYGSDDGAGHTYDCTAPCGIALDLSGVPSSERQHVIVMWGNSSAWDPGSGTGYYLYNAPGNYTIDTNTAAGGSLPSSGWTTQVTVTGNEMGGRLASLDLNGANWVRINVTSPSPIDASGNTDFDAKVDVLSDNSSAPPDTWLFLGDSVTQNSMSWQDVNASDQCCFQTDFMQSLHGAESQYYPTEFNGGIGSWPSENELSTNSDTGETYFQDALKYSGTHYMAIDYGSTNLVNGDCSTLLANDMSMIGQAVHAGFEPVVHYSPIWGDSFSSQDVTYAQAIEQLIHGPALADNGDGTNCDGNGNTYLYMTYPSMLVGPDFYTFMSDNPSLADGPGGIHPTHPSGENAYRQLYVQAALFDAHAG